MFTFAHGFGVFQRCITQSCLTVLHWGYSRVGDGESECVNTGRCGQCVTISEDSVGFSGSVYQPGAKSDHSFVFESDQGTFCEEIVRNVENGVQELRVDSVAAESVYTARKKVPGVNKGDKSCGDDMLGVCPSAATVEGNKRGERGRSVTFSDQIVIYPIPYEDRTS